MSVIELEFFEGDDPNGSGPSLGVLTDEELSAFSLRVALRGIGAGSFSIARSHPTAGSFIRKGNYVRVTIPSIQAEPVWGFWLWEGQFSLLETQGDDTLTFSGPGPLGILRDAILHEDIFAPGQPRRGNLEIEGYWGWNDVNYGGILVRIIEEGQYQTGFPFAPVSLDFSRTVDSAAVAWPNIDNEFQVPILSNVLRVFQQLRDAGDLFVFSDPDFLIQAFQTFGTDRTSSTFAVGKVRLDETNILTSLAGRIHATNELTHVGIRDKDGTYSSEVHPGYTTERARWGSLDVSESNDPTHVGKIGQRALLASTLNTDAFELEVTPGDDELIGRYLPWLHYNVGDTATVDVSTGLLAYENADAKIVAFRVELDEASDDATDDTAHRSLRTVMEFNAATSDGSPIEGRAVGVEVGCRCLELCRSVEQIEATSTAWKIALTGTPPAGWEDVGFDDSGFANAVAVSGSEGAWYDSASPRWIWQDVANPQPSGEERSFRREFVISGDASSAYLEVAADNGCEVYIDGTLVLTVGGAERGGADVPPGNWEAATIEVVDPALLTAGVHCISVIGWNSTMAVPGPAGVYVVLTVSHWALVGSSEFAAHCDHEHYVEALPTLETDTTLVLSPDGGGGVEFRPEAAPDHDDLTGVSPNDHHNEDHASRHASAGADAVKLDDLATPDDNTDLDASTTRHGLLSKLSGDATEYMDGTGAWSEPGGGGGSGALTLLFHQELGSAAADITETGISGAYKDLVVVVRARSTDAANGPGIRLRVGSGSIDTGSNYSYHLAHAGWAAGTPNSTAEAFALVGIGNDSDATAGAFAYARFELFNYADSAKWRGWIGQSFSHDASGMLRCEFGGMWKNAADVLDQLRVYLATGNLDTGSAVTIYGRG